jgi:hypothetical protein
MFCVVVENVLYSYRKRACQGNVNVNSVILENTHVSFVRVMSCKHYCFNLDICRACGIKENTVCHRSSSFRDAESYKTIRLLQSYVLATTVTVASFVTCTGVHNTCVERGVESNTRPPDLSHSASMNYSRFCNSDRH